MMPVLFKIPYINLAVPGYGLMLAVGFLLSIYWAARRAMRSKANPDVILNAAFVALFGGVIGSRAMHVIHYWEEEFARLGAAERVVAIINLTRGGMEFYGGYLLATIGIIVYLWKSKHSLRWYLDILAPSAMVGLAIGRLGCFLNGCCWGSTCELPWAVRFPYGSNAQIQQWKDGAPGSALPRELLRINEAGAANPIRADSLAARDEEIAAAEKLESELKAKRKELVKEIEAAKGNSEEVARLNGKARTLDAEIREAHMKLSDVRAQMSKYGIEAEELRAIARRHGSLPVHPTQIYSTITALIIAYLLDALYWRRSRDGIVICALFIIEPITRIVLDAIRVDNPIDSVVGLTISQKLALGQVAVSILAMLCILRLPARSSTAVEWAPEAEQGTQKGKGGKAAKPA